MSDIVNNSPFQDYIKCILYPDDHAQPTEENNES